MIQNSIIITANLPYLTQAQFENEPSIQREPKKALVAKKDGLALYEKLLTQTTLLPAALQKILLLEIDPSQSIKITALIKQILPAAKIQIKKDLSGLDRLLIIHI
jgi:release factor glutamine methyltransferase